ncbi:DUF2071 domain-containing protein [Ekhidna sp.]|uniref:DUF2071 domain-containing protein n=1 Tax=Ekhidna sp. TaxID=2608089 RepID=UPI0032EE8D8C
MLSYLKNHPFPVEAFFERSLVLTFAVPKEQIEPLIPCPLTLDTFQNEWAFIAVAMVQTNNLRPKDFPSVLGNNFFLIGYRVFVRYRNLANKNLRGLFILKSETDKKKMQYLGNIFTHYNYTTTDIHISNQGQSETIQSNRSNFEVNLNIERQDLTLPDSSPFDSWKEARRFAGPLPFTFTCNEQERTVIIIEGVRNNWKPEPVHVTDYHIGFLERLELKTYKLASAFEVKNIPYYWKKGKLERWG